MTARARRILTFLRDLLVLCAVVAAVLICLGYFVYGFIAFLGVVLAGIVVVTR